MPNSDQTPDYYTVQEAAEALGVTRYRIWTMLKRGELEAMTSPIDRRVKLIERSEIERLSRFVKSKKAVA